MKKTTITRLTAIVLALILSFSMIGFAFAAEVEENIKTGELISDEMDGQLVLIGGPFFVTLGTAYSQLGISSATYVGYGYHASPNFSYDVYSYNNGAALFGVITG